VLCGSTSAPEKWARPADSVEVGKQFIQKRLAFEQLEIAPHLGQIQLPAVGAQQLPDVIEAAVAAGVVVQRLQLEADQALLGRLGS
jgi:hypothetical protein